VTVEVARPSVVVQRREFVRVGAERPAAVERLDSADEPWETTTLDLSGSGVRLALPSSALDVDELVRVSIELPEGDPVVAIARVTRSEDRAVSVLFEKIPFSQRERIVRYVFERLRAGARVA
jgi:c-di-GMP-binding flagellar brake protein YcgR